MCIRDRLQTPHELPEDPTERFCKVYEHIFRIDKHEPFTAAGVKGLVERIAPLYVTYEYITRSREELAEYLERGRIESKKYNRKGWRGVSFPIMDNPVSL